MEARKQATHSVSGPLGGGQAPWQAGDLRLHEGLKRRVRPRQGRVKRAPRDHQLAALASSSELLRDYAWFSRNPPRARNDPVDPTDPQRTAPVGSLRPNDLGLFDVYGNVWAWTQDRVERRQTGQLRDDREDSVLLLRDEDARTRRGGAFPVRRRFRSLRSARNDEQFPYQSSRQCRVQNRQNDSLRCSTLGQRPVALRWRSRASGLAERQHLTLALLL
jgi:formylglycine-generating enzyme required for sulfatase activity